MEFFDRISEVIEFKLTQYGRRKLMSGNFSPFYYSFSDSDILYDSRYAGFSGTQNETSDQITASIRPKLSTFLSTVLDNSKTFGAKVLSPSVLGSSEYGTQKFPAFEVKLYKSNFTGTPYFITSTFLNENIPVLNINSNCLFNTESKSFDYHDYILLEINELNGLFEKENFEFQILKKKNITLPIVSNASFSVETPLEFGTPERLRSEFSGDLNSLFFEQEILKEGVVEYWFEVDTDEQITDVINFIQNDTNIYLNPLNNKTSNNNC